MWDGDGWSGFGLGLLGGYITPQGYALWIDENNHVFAGGNFSMVDEDIEANSIAVWMQSTLAIDDATFEENSFNLSPNPTREGCRISFYLSHSTEISLKIIDITGKPVAEIIRDNHLSQGHHEQTWNGRNSNGDHVRSGVYFVILESESQIKQQKLIVQ
jgi:hypothetical protein